MQNIEYVYIAMPRYGSGTKFPVGVFDSEEKAREAMEGAASKYVLKCRLNAIMSWMEGYSV